MEGSMYIDRESGMKRVMNNAALYDKLLKKFVEKTSLEALESAYASENQETAQVEIHTLKGVSANLSLSELNRLSVETEARIKNGILDQADLVSLRACLAATLDAIKEMVG
jgi:HPt (histidine-containing phosphotransfer) domain-containing protein